MIKPETDEINIEIREMALKLATQKFPFSGNNIYSQKVGFISVEELIKDAREIEKYLKE